MCRRVGSWESGAGTIKGSIIEILALNVWSEHSEGVGSGK